MISYVIIKELSWKRNRVLKTSTADESHNIWIFQQRL